jgi:hypothetical protein
MYINTTNRQITINVMDKAKGVPVKMVFIPGVPMEANAELIDQARKEYLVVQSYFSNGDLKKAGAIPVMPKLDEPEKEADDQISTKDFMLEALQKTGVEEFMKMDKRNSESSVKEAYDKLISGNFETDAE